MKSSEYVQLFSSSTTTAFFPVPACLYKLCAGVPDMMHKRVVDHIPCLYPLPYFGAEAQRLLSTCSLAIGWKEVSCASMHTCMTRAGGTDHLKCGPELLSSQGPSVLHKMQGEAESQSSNLGTFLCDCFLPFLSPNVF